MVLAAEPMSAEEAHAVGFINRLVSQGDALTASLELAEKIAANSPSVVWEAKKGVEVSLRLGLAAGEAFEWETGPPLATTPDAEEGVRAFLEKRLPKFKDR
jgi:enoyl-CoA hydratase/carnithine racemase